MDKIGPYGSIHGRTHRVRPGKPVSGSIGTNADSRRFVQLLIVSEIDRFENLQAVFQEMCGDSSVLSLQEIITMPLNKEGRRENRPFSETIWSWTDRWLIGQMPMDPDSTSQPRTRCVRPQGARTGLFCPKPLL